MTRRMFHVEPWLALALLSCPGPKEEPNDTSGDTTGDVCLLTVDEATVTPLGTAPWDGLTVEVRSHDCEGTYVTREGVPIVENTTGFQPEITSLDCARYGVADGFELGEWTVTGLQSVPLPDGTTPDLVLATPVPFTIEPWGRATSLDVTAIDGTWQLSGGWDCMGLWPSARTQVQPYLRVLTAFGSDVGFQVIHWAATDDACVLVQGAGAIGPDGMFTWYAAGYDVFFDPRFAAWELNLRFAWNDDGTLAAGVEGSAKVETAELSEQYLGDRDAMCNTWEAGGGTPCALCPNGSGTDCLPISFHAATLAPVSMIFADDMPLCDAHFAEKGVTCEGCATHGGGGGGLLGVVLLALWRRRRPGPRGRDGCPTRMPRPGGVPSLRSWVRR